ncbi:MAG: hypothetical protein R3F34_18405 [Planctomycetota bacterium]
MRPDTNSLPSSRAHRAFAVLAGAALLVAASAPSASAQCAAWDKTTYDPAGSLFVEGFLVAQQGVAGVEAFSSSARKWTTVSPPGSSVIGSGDWCLFVREPTSPAALTAYSARLNNSATLTLAGTAPILFASDDDVAFVVTVDAIGTFTAWAYSAVHGVWVPQPLGVQVGPADFAISRFVVGVRDGDAYHGFSARTGAWTTFFAGPGAALSADGNTLLADFTPTGIATVAAFSGVRGCWAKSPTVQGGSPVLLDHNVAYVREDTPLPGTYHPCAYSAYEGAWVSSPTMLPVPVPEILTDNVVQIGGATFAAAPVEAFGAGHATWNPLPPNFVPMYIDEDYSLAFDPISLDMAGFSGLCGGPWVPEPNVTGGLPLPVAPPDHIGGVDTGGALHVFRPAKNMWSPPLPKTPADTILVADATLEVRSALTGADRAIATRWAPWVASGPVGPATAGTGSVIMHQTPAGVIDSFDERCDMWNATLALGAPHTMTAGRNLVVFVPAAGVAAGAVQAYSVQRGDLISPGPIPLPLAVGPVAEENVAMLVDATGRLWAYGSVNDGHVFYQWPCGTEYHQSASAASLATCKPGLFGYGVRANPGSFSYLLLGTTISCPPVVIPGICNELWMPFATTSIYSPIGFHDADCMVEFKVGVSGLASTCIQPWFQPITLDSVSLMLCFGCRRADPAWIF